MLSVEKIAPTIETLYSWAHTLAKASPTSLVWTGDASGSINHPIYLFSRPKHTLVIYEDHYLIDGKKHLIDMESAWDVLIQHTDKNTTWTGYLSYDLGASLHNVATPQHKSHKSPLAVLFQPQFIASYPGLSNHEVSSDELSQHAQKPDRSCKWSCSQVEFPSFSEYTKAFEAIKELILNGDIYQLNLTYEIAFKAIVDSFPFFLDLFSSVNSPFSSYITFENFTLASVSPELFIRSTLENSLRYIETKPMKGTRLRGTTKEQEEENIQALCSSEKELSELSMITDLMRNDLCSTCVPGSVRLDQGFSTMSFGSILQRYSTIKGILQNPKEHPLSILKLLFPGGSISGCPKTRACRRIYEIENRQRGAYTGILGFWTPDIFHWNMLIRTAIIDQNEKKVIYPVGSGIVYDSILEDEWRETQIKARPIMNMFGYDDLS